jgi:hypothetical protein
MLIHGLVALAILWLLTRNFRRAFAIFAVLAVGGMAAAIFLVEPYQQPAPKPAITASAERKSPVWEDRYEHPAPGARRHRIVADVHCIGRQIQDPNVCLLSGPYGVGYHGIDGLRCGYPVSQCYSLDRELARINNTASP